MGRTVRRAIKFWSRCRIGEILEEGFTTILGRVAVIHIKTKIIMHNTKGRESKGWPLQQMG